MIVVTLVCVVLGGVVARVEYLRRKAAFHEREERRYWRMTEEDPNGHVPVLTMINYHARQAANYRRAVNRPWMIVDNTPSP
jgi:hypothetical protein